MPSQTYGRSPCRNHPYYRVRMRASLGAACEEHSPTIHESPRGDCGAGEPRDWAPCSLEETRCRLGTSHHDAKFSRRAAVCVSCCFRATPVSSVRSPPAWAVADSWARANERSESSGRPHWLDACCLAFFPRGDGIAPRPLGVPR